MSITKSQLKSIIKEIVIEVLQEGLGAPTAHHPRGGQPRARSSSPIARPRPLDPYLDSRVSSMTEAVRVGSGGDPMLAAMLRDTATTTLQEQEQHGHAGGSARAPALEQFRGNPEDVFGSAAQPREDGSSHWADLAFMPSKKSV